MGVADTRATSVTLPTASQLPIHPVNRPTDPMGQETEPIASVESPSPKRRNRKKGRRDGDGDEQETASSMEDVATADLISLPSPVAAVNATTFDVFATLDTTTQAMEELAVTQTPTPKEDGLLKLPIHPSSGRLPLTPPSSPEPFLVHSPEKDQSRVAPMSPDVHQQLLSPVVETPTAEVPPIQVQVEAEKDWDEPVKTTMTLAEEEAAVYEQVPVEHETSMLSNTLADMSLTNGSVEGPEAKVETPVDVPVTEVIHDQAQSPVPDDNMEVPPSQTANVNANSISAASTRQVPVAEITVPEMSKPPVLPVEPVLSKTEMVAEPVCVEAPVATEPAPVKKPAVTETTSAEIPAAIEPIQVEIPKPIEKATQIPQNEEKKTLPESSPSPRRNKRKGDSPEPTFNTTPATTSTVFTNTHPSTAVSVSTLGESADSSKQTTSKNVLPGSLQQPRPVKRKGETEVKPPPAPTTAVTSEIRPKRLIARSNLGSTLNKAKTDPEVKPRPAMVARPVQDQKKESMMNPTASSVARATAAEARKALAAAKKAPARKPMRSKFSAKSGVPVPKALSDQHKITAPPPAPVDDGDDMQRNVKRRLNTTDAEAASRRLYEDAKEAKARKDARRVELQETYTFAPQVNNFKRRANPGEAENLNQDHFTRLHAQAKQLQDKKRGLQQQHEREGCTFAPTISARAKRLAQPSSGPRYENLYKHAQEMKQKREEKLLEKAKTTEEQCPFKPKITTSKSPAKTKKKPLYDFEREKQKRLAREQKKIEAEMTECTFKPKVSAKRMKSKAEGPTNATTEAATDANPYNRLYQASIVRTERLQKLRQERDEEEKAQAPFQPKITARSRLLKDKSKTKEPFHKRLYNKDYMKKLDAEREQRRLEEEQQFTFKPEINELPEEIKVKVNERASPQKNIFERLYDEKDKMKEKIEMSEELRLQKEMVECTFRPQIEVDAAQSNGEPAPPVWERLLSYDKAHVIEEREKLKEQLEMQECTFKPEVKSPDALLMKGSPSSNVFDRLTSNGQLDPTRPSFITRRPSSSPGRQSPDSKGASIGRIIKSTKFSLPTERKKLSRTHSISQPSSVNKPSLKRSTSFSGPKSAASSPTMSTADVLSSHVGSRQTEATPNRDSSLPQSITENYESWSAELDAKLRHL